MSAARAERFRSAIASLLCKLEDEVVEQYVLDIEGANHAPGPSGDEGHPDLAGEIRGAGPVAQGQLHLDPAVAGRIEHGGEAFRPGGLPVNDAQEQVPKARAPVRLRHTRLGTEFG